MQTRTTTQAKTQRTRALTAQGAARVKSAFDQTQMSAYADFLKSKTLTHIHSGFHVDAHDIHALLFPFQRDITRWAIEKGRAAIFADVGLGKTYMQGEWTRQVVAYTQRPGLIVTELNVVPQMREMLTALNMDVQYARSQDDVTSATPFYVTNYERLDGFDASMWGSIALDESSILKSFDGKTQSKLIKMFARTPYRLCSSATPAPNDPSEIGKQAEFLGVMSHVEMLATFFTYDSDQQGANAYRLKGWARESFYKWLSSWAVALETPSDVGAYDDTQYSKPPLVTEVITVNSSYTKPGMLPGFSVDAISATDAKKIRRSTIDARAHKAAEMVNGSADQWVIWTALNEEAETLTKMIPDAVNVHGSLSLEKKADHLQAFVRGEIRVLVTKTSIAGKGINMQNCHKMMMFGVDYSWEQFYQAIGRIHRFGQKASQVDLYVLTSQQERSIWDIVESKGKEAKMMTRQLIDASRNFMAENVAGKQAGEFFYATDTARSANDKWSLLLGDSCERMRELPDASVDLSIYSPPFSDIFVYSNSERDLGNSRSLTEFFEHYRYIIRENLRIMKPGRLVGVHCMDTRMMKGVEGTRGRKDFSGMIIEAYQQEGFIFWTRITIDKNPQAQAIRLKDHGLLFKTLKKDATQLSGGHPDYLLVFKAPGENAVPVTPVENCEVTAEDWIRDAHPVWYDIHESDTLNTAMARSDNDEKHLCPLQLPLIRRFMALYSNPNELVFSPFAGIGSEGVVSMEMRRRFLGIELNPNYFRVAARNLKNAETQYAGRGLFDDTAYQFITPEPKTITYHFCPKCGHKHDDVDVMDSGCKACGWNAEN